MAAFGQPRAGGHNYFSVFGDAPATTNTTSTSGTSLRAPLQWGASILGGLAVGAVAALLVGGLLGVHETAVGSVQVIGSSVSHSVTP